MSANKNKMISVKMDKKDNMSEKLDGINEFKEKVLSYFREELDIYEKALSAIGEPGIEQVADVKKMREEECAKLRINLIELRKHIAVIQRMI